MNLRTFVLTVLTLGAITGCASQADEDGPAGPEPEGSGTLEASVVVAGSRPDPDGYAAVVTLASQSEPAARRVDSAGGILLFSDLPLGTHSIRLEDLAANCTVVGANPRLFTIVAERTSRIVLRVACPGPGAISGKDRDPGLRPGPGRLFPRFRGRPGRT